MSEYAVIAAVAAVVTYLLTPLARVLAVRTGTLAGVRDRDVHTIPTPYLGGLALYGGVAAALLVAARLPALQRSFQEPDAVAVLVSGGLICLLGVVDDRFNLDALTKLAGQTLAVGVMILLGLQLLFVPVPGVGPVTLSADVGVPATLLLTLLTINAINFIDGLDGLAGGVVAIAAGAFLLYSYNLSEVLRFDTASSPTLLAAVLVGACLGFLPHNFSPARIFMGDSGSMLLGLVLAAAATSATGQVDYSAFRNSDVVPFLLPILIPVAVLAVPFVDLLLAVVRRTRAGRSPFSPDKRHLHHRLLEIGHSHSRAVLILYLWTALIAFGGVGLTISSGPHLVLAAMAVLACLGLLVVQAPRLAGLRERHPRGGAGPKPGP